MSTEAPKPGVKEKWAQLPRKVRITAIVIGVLLVLAALGSITGTSDTKRDSPAKPADPRAGYSKYDAAIACENAIKAKLKSPATADFDGGMERQSVTDTKYGWIFVGHVDAENSFSAKLRSNYRCEAEVQNGGLTIADAALLG